MPRLRHNHLPRKHRMEIERKYLIKELPKDLEQYPSKEIEQGYLCVSPVVRIRKSNEEYILTYKSRLDSEDSDLRVNKEVEVPLTKEGYEHLREKVDDHLIQKTRYVIDLKDGHKAEMDIFHGLLEGLQFVEVEFEDEEDAKTFQKPYWFGENVSADHRFSNSVLSKCDDLSIFD